MLKLAYTAAVAFLSRIGKFLFSHPLGRVVGAFMLALVVGLGVGWYIADPKIIEVPGREVTRIVTEYKDKLTTKIVTKYIPDPKAQAEVARVMEENKALKIKVTELSHTIATLQTGGTGKPTWGTTIVSGEPIREFEFNDWRLNLKAKDDVANYTLNQKYEVITTAGRDKDGKPSATVLLSEVGPNGERWPATNLQTVVVRADLTGRKQWFFRPAVQAGVALTSTSDKRQLGVGVVGLKWMTRGYTRAAEDGVFSLLTPVVILGNGVTEPGILPVSFNLGRIPYQPFSDIWVSPLLGFSPKGTGLSRYGVSLTATF